MTQRGISRTFKANPRELIIAKILMHQRFGLLKVANVEVGALEASFCASLFANIKRVLY